MINKSNTNTTPAGKISLDVSNYSSRSVSPEILLQLDGDSPRPLQQLCVLDSEKAVPLELPPYWCLIDTSRINAIILGEGVNKTELFLFAAVLKVAPSDIVAFSSDSDLSHAIDLEFEAFPKSHQINTIFRHHAANIQMEIGYQSSHSPP